MQGVGWVSGQGGLQAHTQGGRLRGSGQGVSTPKPGGSLGPHQQGRGWIPACTEADTPLQQTSTAAGGTHPTGMHFVTF